ncbi:5''-methylthioadenosine/S-adenosylhomocysteine nucleosidase [Thiovulum sp. ES]|nr:5''-methylthioadenosine/S-adenosylhomocysteine nucleosidase [Thiovulum sp. ES]
MRIGIIGAMREEIEPILEKVGDFQKIEYAKNIYYQATFGEHELFIVYSKIGKVFSTVTATVLIEKFGVEKVLFSGVAGGISKDLKIGDLIYATKLSQHDLDITAFGHPHGFVPEGSVFVESSSDLNRIADEVATDLGVKLKSGIIASGDQFVADPSRKSWIEKEFGADAVEMEGGSVAVVCDSLGIPFFILRAISDTADDSADVDFDTFLQKSAKVSADFVLRMVEKL